MFTREELEQIHQIDDPFADIEDYKAFFGVFGVELQNEDGSYKSSYECFREASENWKRRMEG